MSFLTKEQRYEMLKGIKYRANPNLPGGPLSIEEENFIEAYATEKLNSVLSDPEVRAVFDSLVLKAKNER